MGRSVAHGVNELKLGPMIRWPNLPDLLKMQKFVFEAFNGKDVKRSEYDDVPFNRSSKRLRPIKSGLFEGVIDKVLQMQANKSFQAALEEFQKLE